MIACCFLLCTTSKASVLYSDCKFGYNLLGTPSTPTTTVYPVSQKCADACFNACMSAFSLKRNATDYGKDIVSACIPVCQEGKQFVNWPLQSTALPIQYTSTTSSGKNQKTVKLSVSLQLFSYGSFPSTVGPIGACKGSNLSLNAYNSKILVKNNSTMKIALKPSSGQNKIYMCGQKSITMTPVIPNIIYTFPESVTGGDAALLASPGNDDYYPTNRYYYNNIGVTTTATDGVKSTTGAGMQAKWIKEMQNQWSLLSMSLRYKRFISDIAQDVGYECGNLMYTVNYIEQHRDPNTWKTRFKTKGDFVSAIQTATSAALQEITENFIKKNNISKPEDLEKSVLEGVKNGSYGYTKKYTYYEKKKSKDKKKKSKDKKKKSKNKYKEESGSIDFLSIVSDIYTTMTERNKHGKYDNPNFGDMIGGFMDTIEKSSYSKTNNLLKNFNLAYTEALKSGDYANSTGAPKVAQAVLDVLKIIPSDNSSSSQLTAQLMNSFLETAPTNIESQLNIVNKEEHDKYVLTRLYFWIYIVLYRKFSNIQGSVFKGSKHNTVTPPQAWLPITPEGGAPTNLTPPRNTHPCFAGLSNAQWNSMSDETLLSCSAKKTCPVPINPNTEKALVTPIVNCFWDWNIRNTKFTDTGISVADGDELDISWGGGKILNPAGSFYADYYDYKSSVMNFFNGKWNSTDTKNLEAASSIDINDVTIIGESLRPKVGEEIKTPKINGPKKTIKASSYYAHGLQTCGSKPFKSGITSDPSFSIGNNTTLESSVNNFPPKVIHKDSSGKHLSCKNVVRPGGVIYSGHTKQSGSYTGGSSATKIQVRHMKSESLASNALGGMQVKVDWGGCPLTNGEGLQYALVMPGEQPQESDWQYTGPIWEGIDIPISFNSNSTRYQNAAINQYFEVYLRIKEPQGQSDPRITDNNLNIRVGSYNVIVSSSQEIVLKNPDNIFKKIVKYIATLIYGDDFVTSRDAGASKYSATNIGVLGILIRAVFSNPQYINIARTTVLLSIVFFTLAFLMGLIQVNARSALTELFKITFVLLLISPDSWMFFSTEVIPFVFDGCMNLMTTYTSDQMVFNDMGIQMKKDKFATFDLFGIPWDLIKSSNLWLRLLGLSLTSVPGFITVLIIISAVIMYLLAIIQATLFFIFSIITLSFLLLLSPLFVPMILFKHTKGLFDKWVKNIFSYMLQPVVLFAIISLLNILLIVAAETAVSFASCKFCFIELPIIDKCILELYYPLYNVNFPSGVSTTFMIPIEIFTVGLFFLILGMLALEAGNLAAAIVTRLILQQPGKPTEVSMAAGATGRVAGKVGQGAGAGFNLIKKGVGKLRGKGGEKK